MSHQAQWRKQLPPITAYLLAERREAAGGDIIAELERAAERIATSPLVLVRQNMDISRYICRLHVGVASVTQLTQAVACLSKGITTAN